MESRAFRLRESLREECAGIMLDALKKDGGVYLSDDEYYRLKDQLMTLLIGRLNL